MTTTIIIELNKLDADPKNVRKAVLIADRLIVGTGWLPAPIRIAVDPKAEADVEINDEAQSLPMAAE